LVAQSLKKTTKQQVLISMPRYAYRCENCKETFEITHGMFFEQEQCIKCKSSGFLTKLPNFTIKKASEDTQEKRVGSVVDEFIQDAKQDLKKQKKKLKTEVFDK
jgi:hypothetical protein